LKKASLATLDPAGRRALIRADLNVPLSEDGRVTDTLRIEASLPTVRRILDAGGSVVLMSHVGRPKGKPVESLRTDPVARVLGELLGTKVEKLPGCVEPEVRRRTEALDAGEVVLLENLRFYAGEKKGDEEFARALAGHGDLFVGDAFGTVHRGHASVAAVPRHLKPAVAGLLLEKELGAFDKVLTMPEKPFLLVLGGAKVTDKIPVLENLLDRADEILIGGGMAYTFLRARGGDVGASLVDEERIPTASRILDLAVEKGVAVHLPTDHVVASSPDDAAPAVQAGFFASGMGLDLGPETRALFAERIRMAKTVVWNGPMGVFEREPFSRGSREVAEAVASTSAFTVIGGGDTAAAVRAFGLAGKMDHVSTGGGASLALLSGNPLPGVEALDPV
jgi:phosphoglycerate kinase